MNQDDTLREIAKDLTVMLASATELVDGIGDVAGYQIKTGALHRILGRMSCAGHPVTIPAAAKRATFIPDPVVNRQDFSAFHNQPITKESWDNACRGLGGGA